MTSRMFFGGWLYPEVASTGLAGAGVTLDENEVACPAMGTDVAQATSAPTKRQFKAFRPGISSLRFT
jgi:hypothetical protein